MSKQIRSWKYPRCPRCGGAVKDGRKVHKDCPTKAVEEPTRPRSVNMTEDQWSKVRRLKDEWEMNSKGEVVRHLVDVVPEEGDE